MAKKEKVLEGRNARFIINGVAVGYIESIITGVEPGIEIPVTPVVEVVESHDSGSEELE